MPAGGVQVLWCGLDVPPNASGPYRGRATLSAGGSTVGEYDIAIRVEGDPVPNHGEDVGSSLARLRWLDSTVGSGPTVTKPFVPVSRRGRRVRVLGRELEIGPGGLPSQVLSFFNSANTTISEIGQPLLAAPMDFIVETADGPVRWRARPGALNTTDVEATWQSRLRSETLTAEVCGRLDYTGSGSLNIRLTCSAPIGVRDIRLEVPWREEAATYFMGLGHRGGLRPGSPIGWTWDVRRHQDCFWMGAVNRGMLLRFKDDGYTRPLCNIYYSFHPLRMPDSWGNAGQGGIGIDEADDGAVIARAFTGPRQLEAARRSTSTWISTSRRSALSTRRSSGACGSCTRTPTAIRHT